jgi:hypothetical protein
MFKDPIAIKNQKPKDVKKSPFDFECPSYDNRSSYFVSAGTDYGIGHEQPIGHLGNAKQFAAVLPQKARTMKVDEKA